MKIYDTGILVEGLMQAIEIPFPFGEVPAVNIRFLNKLFGMAKTTVHKMVELWFESTYPCVAAKLALYEPCSTVIYGEIPFIRMQRPGGEAICIPPPDFKQIYPHTGQKRTFDYPKDFNVFFSSLSGIHESWPWNAESFSVHRNDGMLHPSVIVLGNETLKSLPDCLSEFQQQSNTQQLFELIYEGGSSGFILDSAGSIFRYYDNQVSFQYSSINDMVDSLFGNVDLPFFCFDEAMLSAYRHLPAYKNC